MTGLANFAVKLDDGSGTYPFDITTYVRKVDLTFGRQDELSTVTPATAAIELDNNDGRFTLGSAPYSLSIDQGIRVTEQVGSTVVNKFTGYIDSAPTAWNSNNGLSSVSTIGATDVLARLSRRRLRSMLEQQTLLSAPGTYYTLAEATGATSAGDTSGNAAPAIPLAGLSTGATNPFGSGTGPGTDGLTAAQFVVGGPYLSNRNAGNVLGTGAFTVMGFIYLPPPPSGATLSDRGVLWSNGAFALSAGTLGTVQTSLNAASVSASPATGATHHMAATFDGSTLRLYVDGSLSGSTPATGVTSATYVQIGGIYGQAGGGTVGVFNSGAPIGSLSHITTFNSALNATTIAAVASAGLTGFAGDSSRTRIARIASYIGIPPTAMLLATNPSATNLTAQATSGGSALDAMQNVANTEGGLVYANGDGTLVFQSRSYRTSAATQPALLALSTGPTTGDVEPDLTFPGDKQYLQNTFTGSRRNGATQSLVAAASLAKHGEYGGDIGELLVTTDAEVTDAMNWHGVQYAEVLPGRCSTVTLDLLTQTSTSLVAAVIGSQLGSRLTISSLPTQAPVTTADLLIEGASESISTAEWSITFNTVPASLFQAWVLGDPTYGALNTTTRLFY